MNTIDRNVVDTVSRVMTESFLEDPMNKAQLEGIANPRKLLAQHALMHTRYAVKNNFLTLLQGDPRAFLIGADAEKISSFKEMGLMAQLVIKTPFLLSLKDLTQLRSNMRKHGKVLSFDWHKQFVSGPHYRVKIIAVDKELRGTGAFRKLITPAIDHSQKHQIPMVLETHNEQNVGLYEHFGFELVHTISSPHTHLVQYCMIRKPVLEERSAN